MKAFGCVEAPDFEDGVFVVGEDDALARVDFHVVEAVLVPDENGSWTAIEVNVERSVSKNCTYTTPVDPCSKGISAIPVRKTLELD